MKLIKFIFPVLLTGLLSSCITDYDIGDTTSYEKDCVGVNALLNPLQPIELNLFKLIRGNSKYTCSGLENARVVLKENSTVIYDGISPDSVLILQQNPRAGYTYSVEVEFDGMEKASAQTTVPETVRCNVTVEYLENEYSRHSYLVRLASFETGNLSNASLWLTAYETGSDHELVQFSSLYTMEALADRENSNNGEYIKNKWVGSIYYEGFVRIKNKNIGFLSELLFTPVWNWRGGPDEPEQFLVKLITASPEYDQYCKTLYRQKLILTFDDPLSMMFYQPQYVYSNVNNGLGIFASMNEENYYFDAL